MYRPTSSYSMISPQLLQSTTPLIDPTQSLSQPVTQSHALIHLQNGLLIVTGHMNGMIDLHSDRLIN